MTLHAWLQYNAREPLLQDCDVIQPDFAPEQDNGGMTVTEHTLPFRQAQAEYNNRIWLEEV